MQIIALNSSRITGAKETINTARRKAVKHREWVFVFFVSMLLSVAVFAEQKPLPVVVTGQGQSYWEAREDCVRQALQQSLSQLVIADRRIEDDKIVRDSILSTMNGFVESFKVVNQSTDGSHVQIKAEVQISTSGIENFVLTSGKGSAKIDGNNLLANINRDDLVRISNSNILKRLFDGFPSRAFDVKVAKVSIDPQNRGVILVTVQVQANRQFIKNLKSGLIAISRPIGSNYIDSDDTNPSPNFVTFCFDSNIGDTKANFSSDCRVVSIDSTTLYQSIQPPDPMFYNIDIPFLIWFSGANPPTHCFVITSQCLLPTDASGIRPNTSLGEQFTFTSDRRKTYISEAVHTFVIGIPKEYIIEGSKEIHALPVFVGPESNSPALLNLFEPGLPLHSAEFENFEREILRDQ